MYLFPLHLQYLNLIYYFQIRIISTIKEEIIIFSVFHFIQSNFITKKIYFLFLFLLATEVSPTKFRFIIFSKCSEIKFFSVFKFFNVTFLLLIL